MTTSSEPQASSATVEEAAPVGSTVGGGFIALFALANLGIWFAFFTPFIITLQLKAEAIAPEDPTAALGVVLGVSSLLGIVANPLAGRMSDRTVSRFGMRRPWLVMGFAVGVVGLAIEAASTDVALLTLGACVHQIGFAATLSVLLALIPDHIPEHRRGLASALLGLTQAVATIIGVTLVGSLAAQPAVAFVLPGVVGLVVMVVVCLFIKDRMLRPEERRPFGAREFWGSFWTNPRKHPDFGWAWFSRFAIFLAFAGVVNYQVFYLSGQLGVPSDESAPIIGAGIGLETLLLVVGSLVAGALSDRVGRRRPFVIVAALIGAAGLVVLATATALPLYFVALALIGLAQGTYYSVDLALVAAVLPDRRNQAGKDFGVLSIANHLPQSLAPAIAPLFLAIGVGSVVAGGGPNYTALFIGSAAFAVISAVTILPIKGVR